MTRSAILGLVLIVFAAPALAGDVPRPGILPAFTEEREAAALQFVKRHAADLVPVLEKLKTADPKKYKEEVSEIFQVTELLGDLRAENERRYGLELEVWKTETQALLLVAKLSAPATEDRAKYQAELEDCARRLVDLDMQVLKLQIEELEEQLRSARDDFGKAEEKRDALSKERYQKLFEQAKQRKMMM